MRRHNADADAHVPSIPHPNTARRRRRKRKTRNYTITPKPLREPWKTCNHLSYLREDSDICHRGASCGTSEWCLRQSFQTITGPPLSPSPWARLKYDSSPGQCTPHVKSVAENKKKRPSTAAVSDGRAHFTHFMLRTLLRMRQGEGYIRVTAGSLRNDSRLINNTKKKKSHSYPFYCVLPPPHTNTLSSPAGCSGCVQVGAGECSNEQAAKNICLHLNLTQKPCRVDRVHCVPSFLNKNIWCVRMESSTGVVSESPHRCGQLMNGGVG